MPPKKRQTKAGSKSESSRKKKKVATSDSEFDSDHDNGQPKPEVDDTDFTDENVDESMYPKALDISGRLLVCGGTNWDLIGRKELPKSAKNAPNASGGRNLWGPHQTKYRVKFAASGCTACHSMIITDEGKVMTWGRNDNGQLGLGDTVRRDEPVEVSIEGHQIIGGSVGRSHTLFLTSKGIVFACGSNQTGQLGIGNQNTTVLIPTRISYKGKPINKVACAAEFSMIVDCLGNLYSFGHPQYGQLGHNNEEKYFASGNKLAFRYQYSPRKVMFFVEKTRENHVLPVENVKIAEVACGVNHTVVLDTRGRVFSFGFGAYGRLGHSSPKDELVPRLIKTFDNINRGVKHIWCGSTFSMALDVHNLLYFWGQTKMAGEATMYPKNLQDLNGWNIRSIGCANKSIVVAADDSVISWGPSPTWGELGYGDGKSKSSTIPMEVKPLEGIYVHQVSTGFGHTLFIGRDDSEEEKKLIENLPEWP